MPKVSQERSRAQRRRVIEAAITVFAASGYAAATVDAVCAEAGLSKGALYTYFSSKEELFVAASEYVFEKRLQALGGGPDGGEVRIDALARAFTDSLLTSEGPFLRLWVEGFLLATQVPALAALKKLYHQRFGDLLVAALQSAQARGEVDPRLDPRAAAHTVMALADGLMLYTLVPGLGPDAAEVRRVLAEPFSLRSEPG
jgi:AcrR family transcriptional regulator